MLPILDAVSESTFCRAVPTATARGTTGSSISVRPKLRVLQILGLDQPRPWQQQPRNPRCLRETGLDCRRRKLLRSRSAPRFAHRPRNPRRHLRQLDVVPVRLDLIGRHVELHRVFLHLNGVEQPVERQRPHPTRWKSQLVFGRVRPRHKLVFPEHLLLWRHHLNHPLPVPFLHSRPHPGQHVREFRPLRRFLDPQQTRPDRRPEVIQRQVQFLCIHLLPALAVVLRKKRHQRVDVRRRNPALHP